MDEDLSISVSEEWDRESILAFLKSAQDSHGIAYRGQDWFKWKFRDSPYGPAIISVARDTAGNIAGGVAYGRWRLKYGEEIIEAGVSYETFVHPDYRRRGLFVALADAAARRAEEAGAELLFNFPNPASRPGFLKLGWKDMGGIQTWIRPQSPLSVGRAVIRNKGLSLGPLVPEKAYSPSLENQMPKWLTRAISTGREGVLVSARSWNLFHWRYFSFPTNRYEVAQFGEYGCIYRHGVRGGVSEAQIMDILPTDPLNPASPKASAIRGLVKHIARRGKYGAVSLITTPGTACASRLPWAGFVRVPNRASFLCLPLSSRLNGIASNRQWSLTATDIHTF